MEQYLTDNKLIASLALIIIIFPTHENVNIEQRLTDDFMAFWYEELKSKK
ncbi:hypothetical protein [Photobacterium sp. J15]|nr:hypothetical protein [Photobacterium sp. J15]